MYAQYEYHKYWFHEFILSLYFLFPWTDIHSHTREFTFLSKGYQYRNRVSFHMGNTTNNWVSDGYLGPRHKKASNFFKDFLPFKFMFKVFGSD